MVEFAKVLTLHHDFKESWPGELREQGDCRVGGWVGGWRRDIRKLLFIVRHDHRQHMHNNTIAPSRTTRGIAQLTHCQNVLRCWGPLAWQLQAGDSIWSPPHLSHLPRKNDRTLSHLLVVSLPSSCERKYTHPKGIRPYYSALVYQRFFQQK